MLEVTYTVPRCTGCKRILDATALTRGGVPYLCRRCAYTGRRTTRSEEPYDAVFALEFRDTPVDHGERTEPVTSPDELPTERPLGTRASRGQARQILAMPFISPERFSMALGITLEAVLDVREGRAWRELHG